MASVYNEWFLSGPAQVSGLQLSDLGSTDSLRAQWDRASGDLDSYRVLLVHDSSVIKNESVEADATSIDFHALRPGALYRVVVTTVTAGQTSRQTVAEGRTGETEGGGRHTDTPSSADVSFSYKQNTQ